MGGICIGTRGMDIFPVWMVAGGVCVESVLTTGALRLGTCVARSREGRPNKLVVCKCRDLGLDKLL